MNNRKGFTVVEWLIASSIIGFLLIVFIAVPNALRQTRNNARVQDINALAALIKEKQTASQTGSLPNSCNNTQYGCFSREAKLSYYINTSNSETYITYYRNTAKFDELSPRLDLEDDAVTSKVFIHTYAVCRNQEVSGDRASSGHVAIQYAIETLSGPKLQCKGL